MYHYIYKITCTKGSLNNHYYIGKNNGNFGNGDKLRITNIITKNILPHLEIYGRDTDEKWLSYELRRRCK